MFICIMNVFVCPTYLYVYVYFTYPYLGRIFGPIYITVCTQFKCQIVLFDP